MSAPTAGEVIASLEAAASPEEAAKIRSRVAADEPVIGVRMGTLFEIAKAASALPDEEWDKLVQHPAYEPRMAAFCILDFQARRRIGDSALGARYLDRHDRITAWDMVDRAAPRVVGGMVAGGPYDVLHELSRSPDPLRRRTAITAPLFFVKAGSADDLAEGFVLAATLHADPDPVAHNAVGIFLAHAGQRDPARLDAFLNQYAEAMPRPAHRLATRHRR